MNIKTKLISTALVFLLGAGTLFAQENTKQNTSTWSVGADLVSRYIWRGINLGGSSPSIQPTVEYGFGTEKHAFAIGAWGAYSVSGTQTGQEADLYLSYTLNSMFTLTFTDYFFPNESLGRNKYFNYNMDWTSIDNGTQAQTGHVVEAAIAFNGTEKVPIHILFAMNIWGADSRKYEDQSGTMVPVDKIVMSKYLELGYSLSHNDIGIDLFMGMSLNNPKTEKGEPAGFYGQQSAGVINLGITLSKEVQLSNKFSLPVFGSLITNPEAENIFLVVGISI